MFSKNHMLVLLSIILLLSMACAAPALSATPTIRPQLIFPTSSSLTLIPTLTQPPASATPQAALAQETSTPEPVQTADPNSFQRITFERITNCRLGPAVNYFQTTYFLKDRSAVAEGRNSDSSWLWVRINAAGQHCWVSISNIKTPASFAALPEAKFPPLPEAPAQMIVEKKDCGPRNTVILQWSSVTGETGFHFYRNGIMLTLLKADAVRYTDYPPNGREYFYEIESMNDDGLSVRVALKVSGCNP